MAWLARKYESMGTEEGQLARLDPATGQRTDQAIPGLPAGKGYGAAWFNAAGRLVLYWNAGEVFEIAVSETPTIVDSYPESACKRNDGASCTAG